MNDTMGTCSCINGYYGSDCQLRYCPFGSSWYSTPVRNHEREMPLIECSNMGYCDTKTGLCVCRTGFEGRACERMACHESGSDSVSFLLSADLTGFPIADISVEGFIDLAQTTGGFALPLYQAQGNLNLVPGSGVNSVSLRPCGGRGVCRTMKELAAGFDGYRAVRPGITYTNWDADKIQGCFCDVGWGGYGCFQRTCPFGRDPTDRSAEAGRSKNEQFVVRCQADGGFFSIFVLGLYTQPIPYDADPAYVQFALERLNGVGKVRVKMQADDYGIPAVCGTSSALQTSIWLLDYFGERPPIELSSAAANTRMWPSGGTPLSLSSSPTGSPLLEMATTYTLVCPVCALCSGSVYLTYLTSWSSPLLVLHSGSSNSSVIYEAIMGLPDFQTSNWPGLWVSVSQYQTGTNGATPMYAVCDKNVSVTTTITMTSSMGNIHGLGLHDSTYFFANRSAPANLTLTGTAGQGPFYECSNQGYCDRVAGQCKCTSLVQDGVLQHRATSSDGNGGPGDRGDCGHLERLPSATFCAAQGAAACSGHGTCSNTTGGACVCFDGWRGMTCSVKGCPVGPAWFDEALTPTVAHQPAECSNMGSCDRSVGKCACRWGFTGLACEVFDCPRDPFTTTACSGRGQCMSLSAIASDLHGLAYGAPTNPSLHPNAWDGQSWHNCVCSAKASAGYATASDPRYPLVGPLAVVSGYDAQSTPLPGWSGYDCSRFNCPMGDATTPRNPSGGQLEVQRVVCTGSAYGSNFTLSVLGQLSTPIWGGAGAAAIQEAIQYPSGVGNVTVSFPNVHYDDIATACSARANAMEGGFLVTFLTEYGDLPAMAAVPHRQNFTVSVTEHQKGSNVRSVRS